MCPDDIIRSKGPRPASKTGGRDPQAAPADNPGEGGQEALLRRDGQGFGSRTISRASRSPMISRISVRSL